MNTTSPAFAWPIHTLDFEASGLGPETYPIEVGVARWHGPGTAIRTWSSLIAPTMDWRTAGDWQATGKQIHGIARASLADAPTPREVMAELNRLCPLGTLVFCDGGDHDRRWMQKLADAADTGPYALIGSWGHVVSSLDDGGYNRIVEFGNLTETAHRAGPDARDNMLALAHAIGAPAPAVLPWAQCLRRDGC